MTRSTTVRDARPPKYGLHFLATTVLTLLMLGATTLYFSFKELRHTAQDISSELLRNAGTQAARGESAAEIAQRALASFRDVEHIELCIAGECVRQHASEDTHVHSDLINSLSLPCTSLYGLEPDGGSRATVCMGIDDVLEDIGRDVAILLFAQSIGFAIWLAASRRYAARSRVWNERVRLAATTDTATGLLNRAAFREALGSAVARGDEAWLVLVGIDDLKSVNELHGSAAGDQVILSVTERLKGLGDLVALGRTGGDEFAFMLRSHAPSVLERALWRLRTAMSEPVSYQGLQLTVSVSAGAALVEAGCHASELLRRAHVALRAAKKVGPDCQTIFNIAFDIELRKTHQLRLDLMGAVDKGQVELVYQPIVDARGQVVVAEALARWHHPEMGPVSPETFIAAAESSGLIHQLGIALLKKACDDLVKARSRGLPLKRMAVNLSPYQLNNPDIVDVVLAVVRDAGLQPGDIELELTESAAMASREDATLQLRSLSQAGVAISIDDFGTGYSSLSRLQTLPIGKLKIDRSFVQRCDEASSGVLLEAMIDLAHRLGLDCVAEGVETQAQMAWLRERGCDLYQGYLIGKPMKLEQLVGMGFRVPVAVPVRAGQDRLTQPALFMS